MREKSPNNKLLTNKAHRQRLEIEKFTSSQNFTAEFREWRFPLSPIRKMLKLSDLRKQSKYGYSNTSSDIQQTITQKTVLLRSGLLHDILEQLEYQNTEAQSNLSGLRKQKTWLQEHFFAYAAHYHAENRGISKWSTNGGTSARKPTEMCSEISKSFRTEANHNLKNRLYMRRLFN
ncbi:hypothetical protein T4E_9426 [Trichinella pseudospiralis]|uniref:Uncharacterized protein n=1 Tax=Trichinella pseudospiralis TaxID=6337 RepID=A0A0V0XFY5_TRIPS|nr:hypothetical protein T4E_9426 [Trichinella pseudospiralis]